MTTAEMVPVPAPGSDAALDAGCTCPVVDNGHGRCPLPDGNWWVAAGCPVHAPGDAR